MTYYHPKYHKEMRAKRRKLQAASSEGSSEDLRSSKPQAEGSRPERPSAKHQAPSVKLQADIKNPE